MSCGCALPAAARLLSAPKRTKPPPPPPAHCTLPPPLPPPRSGASYYEGSFSNISRNPDGDYVAVSSRGNFFMTWSPGERGGEGEDSAR